MLAPTGDTFPVGALIAVLAGPRRRRDRHRRLRRGFKPFDASFSRRLACRSDGAHCACGSEPAVAAATDGGGEGEARVSPIAKRLAEKLGIDLSQVTGTGRNGRISKEDVEAYAASLQQAGSSAVAPAAAAGTAKAGPT